MFNPSRMSLARKRRRFTSKALAGAVGVSPVTITRIETGKNEPDPKTVASLASELGFPEEFFYGDEVDRLNRESASFRSMTSMTARQRDAALASGELGFMVSEWILKRFNLPAVDVPDLGNDSDPAGAARSLRQHWGLGEKPISNMIKLLESKGVFFFSLCEDTKKVDAFSYWRNDVPYVFLNTFKTAEHSRFDTAHELGHLVLHRHGGPQGKGAEAEANAFASSFLMPRADVFSRLPRVSSVRQIIAAKKRWRVSATALTYRLHKLGILSDWQYRSFCIQLGKRGYRGGEPGGIPREASVVWNRVLRELWSDGITKDHIAKELHIPVAEIEVLVEGLLGDSGMSEPAQREARPAKLKLV